MAVPSKRRQFLRVAAAGVVVGPLGAYGSIGSGSAGRGVVVGGSFGGATTARYHRMWSNGSVAVTLVEPNPAFVSCPLPNLVLAGSKTITGLTTSYDNLVARRGIGLVRHSAVAIDPEQRQVRLAGGGTLPYDRPIPSPGIDFLWSMAPSLASDSAQSWILHAWKAGPQTVALRGQLEAMPDGGVYVLTIPLAPYRCPPAPASAPARLPGTSSAPRYSCWMPIRTSSPNRDSSDARSPSSTRASSSIARTTD